MSNKAFAAERKKPRPLKSDVRQLEVAMSFTEEELIKIRKATSGWFKKSARTAIAHSLLALKPKIDSAKKLDETERQAAFKKLMNEATAARQHALQSGANSYGHPQWAAAAACESWLHELVGGTPGSIARVEALIEGLSRN
ncbi:hypothetical protein C5S39_01565 [Candidatus Methanophagaceae archaeon]|nr:hypothetical protein C5S39_01565 [Methanophagales archaeon]